MIRGRKIVIIIISIILLLFIAVALFQCGDDTEAVELYYMNENMTSIVSEEYKIPKSSREEMIDNVMQKLSNGPSKQGNKAIMQKSTIWSISKSKEGILVDMSMDFLGENPSQNVLATYAVIKSLCSIEGVNSVKVTAGGQDIITLDNKALGYLNGEDINLSDTENTDNTKTVKLYFSDKDGNLSYLWRRINLSDTVSVGQMVVEELINGPDNANFSPVIASDIKILSFEVTQSTAYINMPQSFIDKNKSTPKSENNAVYSIVNSLCKLDMIESVQFLIDGKKIHGFETVDISIPLTAQKPKNE